MTVNEALRDLLQAAKPKVSLDALDREARDKGISIARNTIARARRGELGPRPKEETVQALADLFGVDPRKIREAVGRPPGELGPFEPDPRSASLTQAQRDALNQLIVAIVSQEGGQLDGQQPEAEKTPPSTPADELDRRRRKNSNEIDLDNLPGAARNQPKTPGQWAQEQTDALEDPEPEGT